MRFDENYGFTPLMETPEKHICTFSVCPVLPHQQFISTQGSDGERPHSRDWLLELPGPQRIQSLPFSSEPADFITRSSSFQDDRDWVATDAQFRKHNDKTHTMKTCCKGKKWQKEKEIHPDTFGDNGVTLDGAP